MSNNQSVIINYTTSKTCCVSGVCRRGHTHLYSQTHSVVTDYHSDLSRIISRRLFWGGGGGVDGGGRWEGAGGGGRVRWNMPFFGTSFLHGRERSLSALLLQLAFSSPAQRSLVSPRCISHLSASFLSTSGGRALPSASDGRLGFCCSSSCLSFLFLSTLFFRKSESDFRSEIGLLWLFMRHILFWHACIYTCLNKLPSQMVCWLI